MYTKKTISISKTRSSPKRSSPANISEPWIENIRNLRTDRDLTQQEVADHLGVSQRVYSDYELGRVRIPVEHLTALASYYNVSLDYICGTG